MRVYLGEEFRGWIIQVGFRKLKRAPWKFRTLVDSYEGNFCAPARFFPILSLDTSRVASCIVRVLAVKITTTTPNTAPASINSPPQVLLILRGAGLRGSPSPKVSRSF